MSESPYQMVADEKRLDAATKMLAGLQCLTPVEAKRIGARIDGLASQLAAASAPDRDSVADGNDGAD